MPSRTFRTRARRLGLRTVAVALASAAFPGMVLWSTSLAAQTLFAWPDTTVNIEAYTTLDECQAAVSRSLEYAPSREGLESGTWADTLPLDSLTAKGLQPLPAAVTETARRCGARFSNVDSVSLSDFRMLLPLYLQAGWDSRAGRLVERRLGSVGEGGDAERAAVIDSSLEVLLGGKGVRIGQLRVAMAEQIAFAQLPRVSDRVKRLQVYGWLAVVASSDKNLDSATAKVQRITPKMAAIMDSLTEPELDRLLDDAEAFGDGVEDADDFAQRYYAMLNMSLGKRTFLDSLRQSTAAYVKLKRDNWARATGMRQETYKMGDPLGEQAPPIVADIWLGYDPSKGPRPTPGRVSLMVFLGGCNGVITYSREFRGGCARSLVPLRWLEERFPELDVTVVERTRGYFQYLKDGMSPEREAELTKQTLEWFGVHAALAMTATDNWRLPDPDSRRIDRPTKNYTNYTFGMLPKIKAGTAFLIDQDGIVVHTRNMNRTAVYEDFEELIEILLERQAARTAS